jgi:hypothetical protein
MWRESKGDTLTYPHLDPLEVSIFYHFRRRCVAVGNAEPAKGGVNLFHSGGTDGERSLVARMGRSMYFFPPQISAQTRP